MEKGDRKPINVSEGCFLPITVSASCFLPAALFYSLEKIAKLAKRAGFAGVEAIPFRGAVLSVVPENPAVPITSAHCHFNPIPIGQKVKDFGKGAALTDVILFPPNVWCEKFLTKLNRQGISVSTYFVEDLRRKGHIYNSFQLHPDLGMTLGEVVSLLEETGARATTDLRHLRRDRDPRQGGGPSPFPNWRTTWEVLNSRGLVDNVHVQYRDSDSDPDLNELQGMLAGDARTEIAEMLRVIGQSDYKGLLTLEITMTDMARLFGPKTLLPSAQVRRLSQLRQFVEAQLAN